MKVSLNWIKEYLDFELPLVDELVEKIGSQLGAVEEVIDLGARYQNLPIVKVVICEPLENSDHLHRCLIDDGGAVKDAERDEKGLVQVITGAPNVHAGMLAVWLPPGATVPESVSKGKDPFVLTSREMRGSMSHGMLASAKELAIGDSHEGLLDLTDEKVVPTELEIRPGADFAKVFGLDDVIIDIENKMFTHRPDCFGQLGVAREIAGILGHRFTSPERYRELDKTAHGSGLKLEIANEIPERVPRFMAAALKNVEVKPSPLWLQIQLAKVGAKPISNVVDVTNYMMLLTGQPLHAYDYDKVRSGTLGARLAKPGEKLKLLNGKTIELDEADMVITDGTRAVGLAGVMGGSETEVSAETKNIILECATFDMYAVRRTAMRHGLFTDAVTRFNKGQSPLQNPYVVQLAVGHLQTLTGGETASDVIDDDHTGGRASLHPPVKLPVGFINERLGSRLKADEAKKLLENVEFGVKTHGEELTVTAPFWRTDIELREDVVEEVGRLYGFDKLPLVLPRRDLAPALKNPLLELKAKIRSQLARAGASEVLTYSFVPGSLLAKAGQDKAEAFRISNALSPDLQYYRLSLTPSLLDKVHMNIKAGYDEFALFELGKVHIAHETDADGLPAEFDRLALIFAANAKTAQAKYTGAAYYQAAKYLDSVFGPAPYRLVPLAGTDLSGHELARQMVCPYEPNRSAAIYDGERLIGVAGEYRPSVQRALKLPLFCAGFELFLSGVPAAGPGYIPLPRFPGIKQDITLKVPADILYADLHKFVGNELGANAPEDSLISLEGAVSIYQKPDDLEHKQITFRAAITGLNRTLTDKEVAAVLNVIAAAAKSELKAERV